MLAHYAAMGIYAGRQYTDLGTSTTLTISTSLQNNRQLIFGTSGDDSRGLTGGKVKDALYGGAGNDT